MMTALANITPQNLASAVPTADPVASQALALASNLLFRDYPAMPEILSEPLSVTIRLRLGDRLAHLDYKLAGASQADVRPMAAAISGLLGAFPTASPGSAEATVAKYIQVVRDLPLWAVLEGCEAIENGKAEGASLDFRPAAPRLRQVSETFMAPWLEERSNIRKVLRAPALEPQDAQMCERLKKLLEEFSVQFKAGKFKEAP